MTAQDTSARSERPQAPGDDALLELVLERLLSDDKLGEKAQELVYAAVEGAAELAAALGDGRPLPSPTAVGTTEILEPAGAYLTGVTVAGFRGIGAECHLPLHPGPGLTVVAGRNGCGKSSFAEAVELVLTGENRRWSGRPVEWKAGWRNLHAPEPAYASVDVLIEGQQPATAKASLRWTAGSDDVDDHHPTLQITGQPVTTLDTLGWSAPLETYRPFLSYIELGASLTGHPTALYDALANILGLGRITTAHDLLKATLKQFTDCAKAARTAAEQLRRTAAQLAETDERASSLASHLTARTWDLDELERLGTGSSEPRGDSERARLHVLAAVQFPADLADSISAAVDELDAAAQVVTAVQGSDADRADTLAALLETALSHHEQHPGEHCPVCRGRVLDDEWAEATRQQIEQLRHSATAVRDARARHARAVHALRQLLPPMPAGLEPAQGKQLSAVAPARAAWQPITDARQALVDLTTPAGAATRAPVGLVDTVETLNLAVEELQMQASARLRTMEDRWRPVAVELSAWLPKARQAQDTADLTAAVKKASDWLRDMTDVLRNQRLAPLAEQTTAIWQQLRQDSNVDLGGIRLQSTGNRRRVNLSVAVDGTDTTALAVMSQGELHALALALFIPRATTVESPFRFLVIDDPVQAMDPAKVDGLARVLTDVARTRQVIVFTHDDRLPAALRRLRLNARLLQVTRQDGSRVHIDTSDDPAQLYLTDARALTKDDHIPAAVVARVVPGLCRLAIDTACVDLIRKQRLTKGAPHHDVERLLTETPKLFPRLTLALFDDPNRSGDTYTRLNMLLQGSAGTVKAVNAGAHTGADHASLEGLIRDTKALVKALQR